MAISFCLDIPATVAIKQYFQNFGFHQDAIVAPAVAKN